MWRPSTLGYGNLGLGGGGSAAENPEFATHRPAEQTYSFQTPPEEVVVGGNEDIHEGSLLSRGLPHARSRPGNGLGLVGGAYAFHWSILTSFRVAPTGQSPGRYCRNRRLPQRQQEAGASVPSTGTGVPDGVVETQPHEVQVTTAGASGSVMTTWIAARDSRGKRQDGLSLGGRLALPCPDR